MDLVRNVHGNVACGEPGLPLRPGRVLVRASGWQSRCVLGIALDGLEAESQAWFGLHKKWCSGNHCSIKSLIGWDALHVLRLATQAECELVPHLTSMFHPIGEAVCLQRLDCV